MTIQAQIIQLTTQDNFNLYGAWYHPQDARSALLCIHGFASNFARTPLRNVAEYLVPHGYACLVINTRGHDRLANTEAEQPAEGAYVEKISDSPRDIDTALAWLRQFAFDRIYLIGHSLGALKLIHYLAHFPAGDGNIGGLISCSCPRWEQPVSAEQSQVIERAREMQAAGQAYQLLYNENGIAIGSPVMLLDRLSAAESYKPQLNAAQIALPAFYLAGEAESEPFRVAAHELANAGGNLATTRLIQGADHNYSDREQELAQAIQGWLAQTV